MRRKVKRKVKVLVICLIILSVNLKFAIPLLIEELKAMKDRNIVDNYISGYNNSIEGTPRKLEEYKGTQEKYIGAIEIPKLKIRKGLVSPYSKANDVRFNVQFIKPYHFPNEDNKVVILASHSGTSKVSYFDKLRYINLKDSVYIYYKNKKYNYRVIDKYKIRKTGSFIMNNSDKKTLLVLITCDPSNKKKQIVVISERVS